MNEIINAYKDLANALREDAASGILDRCTTALYIAAEAIEDLIELLNATPVDSNTFVKAIIKSCENQKDVN